MLHTQERHCSCLTNLNDFILEPFHHSRITAATAMTIIRTRMPATTPMIHRLDGPTGGTDDVIQFSSSHRIAPCTGRVSVPSRTLFVCSAHWLTSLAMVPLSMLPDPAISAWKRTLVGSLGLQAHLPLVMWSWVRLQLHICFRLVASCSVRAAIFSGPRSVCYMWEDIMTFNCYRCMYQFESP